MLYMVELSEQELEGLQSRAQARSYLGDPAAQILPHIPSGLGTYAGLGAALRSRARDVGFCILEIGTAPLNIPIPETGGLQQILIRIAADFLGQSSAFICIFLGILRIRSWFFLFHVPYYSLLIYNVKEFSKPRMTAAIPPELEMYRARIDALDHALIDILAQRFEVVRAVGALKAREGMDVVQPARAQMVIERAVTLGLEKGLDPVFIRALYESMIDTAHRLEHEILQMET